MINIKKIHVIEIGYKIIHKDIKNQININIKLIINVKLNIRKITIIKKMSFIFKIINCKIHT